jgi:hypothetical protein
MPNPTYDGAVQVGGALRGYRAGRITVTTALRHYTVGVNSLGTCGRDFQFLQARNGVLYQGAEVDAKNWGAGEPWNSCAVHVEAEWHPTYNAGEPVVNDAMADTLGGLAAWLESEWGVRRAESYHGPDRVRSWRGWTDHAYVIQTGDWHHNSWPVDEWERVVNGAKGRDEVQPGLFQPVVNQPLHPHNGKVFVYDYNTHTRTWVRSQAALNEIQYTWGQAGVDAAVRTSVAVNMVLDARDLDAVVGGGGTVPENVATKGDVLESEERVRGDVNKARTVQ